MLPYDSHWPPGQISYPPLPPPTPDETSFLNDLAAIGEQWPIIMQERSLRVQEIENRISSNRLANALPQFESFGLASNDLAQRSYDLPHHQYQQQQPPPPLPLDYRPPVPPQHQFQLESNHRFLPHEPEYSLPQAPRPYSTTRYGYEGGYEVKRDRWENQNVTTTREGGSQISREEHIDRTRSAPTTTHTPQWWDRPLESATAEVPYEGLAQRYQSGYPQTGHETLPTPAQQLFPSLPNLAPSTHHPILPLHPQISQSLADRYQLPPPVSQLPYQPPSKEWNQALPPSYTGWEQPPVQQPQTLPSQSRHQESFSSTNTPPLLAAGMTYATSATSQSTDRSRQSSSTFIDFASANDQLLSTASTSGAGKRTRIDSANYIRPPLQPFLEHPSSSSQYAPSSSSSLPTASSTSHATSSTSVSSSSLPPVAVPQPPNKPAPATSKTTNRRGTKTKVDVPISCNSCGVRLARLILRGQKHELDVPYETIFHCLNCSPPLDTGGGSDQSPLASVQESSASESPPDPRQPAPQPRARRLSSTSTPQIPKTFRKKNKRLDVGATLTACDVCLMDRATGSVLPREPEKGHSINFQIEVVCVSCDEKYRRCSDCGGGGGIRLGTGKWRSKELFKEGKKTCSLRHQRLGAFPEMEYQIWKNTDLPREELEEISQKCGEMFTNQMLGAIAIPEVLERNGAIWTSFAEAQSHAHSGWNGMDPMIRYNIEPTQGIRRYLALRLCAPNLRKTSRKGEAPAPVGPPRNGQVFKGDKEIVGYIIAEWAMHRGVLFLALVIPWDATGEAYDATTLLLQALCTRVQQDQQEENRLRYARGEPLLPKLERVFTMIFFKTGSRMITQLTKKRGFAPLEEYLAANPEADPLDFPPYRPIYLPVQRQQGWLVLVRTLREHADGRVDDWSARRTADEERGKKKELKAKAARDKRVQDSGFE